MEASEVVRRNEAIAKFMGFTCPPTYDGPNSVGRGYYGPNELRYHDEYQWIMPVVEKISQNCDVSITFWRAMADTSPHRTIVHVHKDSADSRFDGCKTGIETIFVAVSEYCLALEEPSPAAGV